MAKKQDWNAADFYVLNHGMAFLNAKSLHYTKYVILMDYNLGYNELSFH
jgi:hypothetical protein